MAWSGFISESKRFCGYENKGGIARARWWIACIFDAGPKFYFYTVRGWWQMRHVRKAEREAAAKLKRLQTEFDAYRNNAETAVKQALRQHDDA